MLEPMKKLNENNITYGHAARKQKRKSNDEVTQSNTIKDHCGSITSNIS